MSEHIEALKEHLERKGLTDMETEAHVAWITRENAELAKGIHLACDDRDYFFDLQEKEKARLDWLLREYNLYRFGYEERFDRADIDKAMKED